MLAGALPIGNRRILAQTANATMPAQPIFADIHCHPNFKPYAQTFTPGNARPDPQPGDAISLWHGSGVSSTDNYLSEKLGVAMYTQCHFSAAAMGGLQVLCLSLGGLEQEFITISRPLPQAVVAVIQTVSGGSVDVQNFLFNLATRFGVARLNKVRAAAAYFPDLIAEIAFIQSQEGRVYQLEDGKHYTYCIAKNGGMVADILAKNAAAGAGSTAENPITLCLALTMEGLHNLDAGLGAGEEKVLDHVMQLKSNTAAPLFFVTFTHHFWNGLCGHAQSLPAMMTTVFDQSHHMGEGFTPLGFNVLMTLLDQSKGRRILIDIKHLSYKARTQYFNLLAGSVPDDPALSPELKAGLKSFFKFNMNAAIGTAKAAPPVIVSHIAVNGYHSPEDKSYYGNYPAQTATGVMNPFENSEIYAEPGINFYDSDLLNIARFKGLAGIQLDKHRISGPAGMHVAMDKPYSHAYLVWNQVLHMVELWDQMGIGGAWDHLCIGSDFDGIISPLDGMHKASDFPLLREGLLHYCRLYFIPTADFIKDAPGMGERGVIANCFQFSGRNPSGRRLNPDGANAAKNSRLTPEQIVDKICSGNVMAFMKTYFI